MRYKLHGIQLRCLGQQSQNLMKTDPLSTGLSSTVTGTPVQLPMWPQELRALPNVFARSALFTVANVRKGARPNLKRHVVVALKGISITYTGEELRQDDEDVFLQILHLARMQELGSCVRFTAHSMISDLSWTRNNGSYLRLVDCLDRLNASSVAVTVEGPHGSRENYTGSFIRSFRWREDSTNAPLRDWEVLLEKEIISLFNPESYSRLDWKVRLKLPPLAKWLHTFYHSHQRPFPFKVETLWGLTGSETKNMRMFRFRLRAALELLVEHGFLISASIDSRTDTVIVERSHPNKVLG